MAKQNRIIRRNYTGADYGRLWNDWLTSSTSANAELYAILPTLRDRCRDLARNDVYAGGAIRLFCDNILGECGFNFQAKVKMLRGDGLSEPINRAIEDLIKHWSLRENCDVRGLQSFTQLERLIVRTWAESGEVLIRKVRRKFGNSKIPYALQVLEPDYLVEDHQVHLANSESTVEMGVQTDKWGRVEGYWLYKGHPGDRINTGNNGSRYEVEFVPASEMDHIYICDRPGQLRGVPLLAIAIKRLHLMADTEEAELVASKLAAFVGGVIKTKDTDNFSDSMRGEDHDQAEQDATGDEFRNFEPGMFMKLHPEEDAMPFTNNRPNQALPDFTKHIMRGFSTGVGLSYSGVSNDFSDASYSSHRAEKLKEIRSTRYYQNELKEQFHSRQIREVISTAWLVGAINLPGFEVAEERYLAHQWLLPAFDWIDPKEDIAAAFQSIEGGLSTYSIELGKRNLDFEEILQQRKFEKEKLIEAGLLAPTDPGGDKPALKEGLAAVRSLLEGQSEEMRTILRQLESAPDVGAILLPLIQRAIDPTPVTVEVISPEGSRDIVRGAKNCKKGKPCGGSCQSKTNVCFVGLSAEQKALALKARKAMASGGGIASELPEQSPKTVFSGIVTGNHSEINDEALSNAFQSIKDDQNRQNIEKIESFITSNNIQAVFYQEGTPLSKAQYDDIYEKVGVYGDDGLINVAAFVVASPPVGGSLGHTHRDVDFVVVKDRDDTMNFSPKIGKMREGIEQDLGSRSKSWTHGGRFKNRSEETMMVYLHEVGHQMHFKSGAENNRPAPTIKMMDKSQTLYGRKNAFEYTAENFVAWAIAPNALKSKDKKAYDYIESVVDEALSGRLRNDPNIPYGG